MPKSGKSQKRFHIAPSLATVLERGDQPAHLSVVKKHVLPYVNLDRVLNLAWNTPP